MLDYEVYRSLHVHSKKGTPKVALGNTEYTRKTNL